MKLPQKIPLKGLDNLVEVNYQGNSILVGIDSPEDQLYLFFPSECQISEDFLKANNLFKHTSLNADPSAKPGFFEDNRRVKAIKFRGMVSTGFMLPITSLDNLDARLNFGLNPGDEFNELNGIPICKKYIRRTNPGQTGFNNPKVKIISDTVDAKQVPEHMDTSHLMKNLHKFNQDTRIVVTYKLHGTSARTFRSLVKRKLNWKERLAKKFGVKVVEEEYDYIAASRRMIKSIGFEELPNKNHYYNGEDLWSWVAKQELEGRLNKGEAVYYEIIGKTMSGEEIQGGYSYGFNYPKVFVYRISNINADGIETDLSWDQMQIRANQLGLEVVPILYRGTMGDFISNFGSKYIASNDLEGAIEKTFYNDLLEQPSILDKSVVEEGFCIRVEGLKPDVYKIKSKKFLAHESKAVDKQEVNLEDQEIGESISRASQDNSI